MTKYAAEIDNNNIVLRVIVVDDMSFCNQLGGTWVETYLDTQNKNYAGSGYIYYPDKDNFSTPKPYDNWILNDNCIWEPPIPKPEPEGDYWWNQETNEWLELVKWEPPIPKPEGDYWWNQETNEWLEIPEQYINIEDI